MGIFHRLIRHLPSHPHPSNSRKYLRLCHKSQVFQLTSLPFGLATAPQLFTMIVKEVKLMALTRDDWLIRAQCEKEAQVNTQTVVDLTQSLGWIINQEKSKLKPAQVFSFMGYEYHLDSALVKPTQERWLTLQDFILRLKSKHVLTARYLMSLIGLLASTEKMVPEGRLHMRPFQFHLKKHWRFPQSLCPPHCGVDILFLLFPASNVRHAWVPVISRKSIYPMFTKFGMGVDWVNSLHGIDFGEDSSIAN